MSKYLRVHLQEQQSWGYVRVGDTGLTASLSVHQMGALGVPIGDVVAISHVWGDAKYDVENVQGASHQIKISSPEKMRRITSIAEASGWENLWLDNICINQEDDDEKSREIMKMGQVYRQTKATVILLNSTCSKMLRETLPMILRFQGQTDEAVSDEDVEDILEGLTMLGNDEWYVRLWTVQESTLATRIYMAPTDEDILYDVCGLRDCKAFWMRLITYVNFHFLINCDDQTGKLFGKMMTAVGYRWVVKADLSMIDALDATREKGCSDIKDRVYGILGLVRNVSIIPAYGNTTPEDVAVMVMKECVNSLREMDLLHLHGSKMEQVGKGIVPSWRSLEDPSGVVGRILHQGNCTYDENVGLMILSPRVFRAEIVTVIESDMMSSYCNIVMAMKQGMVDDEIIQLIRGMMFTLASSEYWDERHARDMFCFWSYLASLPQDTNVNDVLESVFHIADPESQFYFLDILNKIRVGGIVSPSERAYILRIRKDNNCTCSCCQRTYISVVRSHMLLEDKLLVMDYGGHFVDDVTELEIGYESRNDRIPLIVTESDCGGKAKFVSTIVQDRGILHKSMTSGMEAMIIV